VRVHAERLIHKLDTFCEAHVRAKELIRHRIWWLYADLKAYRQAANLTPRQRAEEQVQPHLLRHDGLRHP
jgi:hypothetical protein